MTSVFRVGIVGCGEVTQIMHLPSLYQLNAQFQVTALCDVSDSVLNGVADIWRVSKRYHDYHDLIAQPDVDIVLIANPNVYHAEVLLAAIVAQKHVLVEKPMCMTIPEADQIIAAVREHPAQIVQVGYMRRYAPAFMTACQMIAELGAIRLARVHDVLGSNSLFIKPTSRVLRGNDIPSAIVDSGKRRNDQRVTEAIGDAPPDLRQAYGLMLGLSSHDISAMRELLGRPQRVLYAAQRHGGLYLTAAFDYGDYVCHYETGIDHIPRFDAHLEVYGADRVLRVEYDTPYVRNLPIKVLVVEANDQGGVIERVEQPSWGDAFVAEWQALYANIIGQVAPKTSPADFRQDLELFRDMIALMRG